MQKPVEECWGCARILGGRCRAITSPRQMWADGECWAYTDDPAQIERERDDIQAYPVWLASRGGGVAGRAG